MAIRVFLSSCHYLLSKAMKIEYSKFVSFRASAILSMVILLNFISIFIILMKMISIDLDYFIGERYRLFLIFVLSGIILLLIEKSISDFKTLEIRNIWLKQLNPKREKFLISLCLAWVILTFSIVVPGSLIYVAFM